MPDRQAEMRLMLRALRLPAIAAVYEDLALKAAKANLTHEEFLYELLRAECLQREEHRVARLLRLSGLPPDKTFRTLQLEQAGYGSIPRLVPGLQRIRGGEYPPSLKAEWGLGRLALRLEEDAEKVGTVHRGIVGREPRLVAAGLWTSPNSN